MTSDTIIAVVGDDDRFDHVRRRVIELARERAAGIVLYDIDAGSRLLESPKPTNWSAEGEEEQFRGRLDVKDLEALGRGPLADQVRRTRADEVEAWGWLPDKDDADTLRDYVGRVSPALVVLAAEAGDLTDGLAAPVEIVGASTADSAD
jgi:hypothetical protein